MKNFKELAENIGLHESGEHEGPHPCEGRTRKKEGAIPFESGDPDTHDP